MSPTSPTSRMRPGTALVALGVAALAGCAGNVSDGFTGPDAAQGGDGACAIALSATPNEPVAVVKLQITSQTAGAFGVLDYTWHVVGNGAPATFAPVRPGDSTAIEFTAATPGIYTVTLDVAGSNPPCPQGIATINVGAPGALTDFLRLRVVPPVTAGGPPFEKLIAVKGGAPADLGPVVVDPGVSVAAQVNGPTGGVPAYLRFSPGGTPDAFVEAFSDARGIVGVQLVPASTYTVLAVPSAPGLAPRGFTGWSFGQPLALDTGAPISGTVRDPANAPLAGAMVRLVLDGVPSTLTTTGTDGSFTVRGVTPAVNVTVDVLPPVGSGLPRLSASSQSFDLSGPLQVRYAANVALSDLGGAVVKQLGTPVPGARVTLVGSLATAGMVTAGRSAVGSGEVRIVVTTDASGALPPTLVPTGPLSAVVEFAPGKRAVVGFNTSAGVPATLDALPQQLITSAVLDAHGAALPGATVDLVPAGALALASAPIVRLPAMAAGAIAADLPAGGHYALRFQDPQGRAGPLLVGEHLITAIAASYQLPAAVRLEGSVRRNGMAMPGAAVQILCISCSGIDRTTPLVEAVSDAAGRFTLAVPDPGTR